MSDNVFVDIETTGLQRERHQIVELAWALGPGPIQVVRLRHTLKFADPDALKVNRYHERGLSDGWSTPEQISRFLIDARGNTLVAANPAFDAGFMQDHFGFAPWHYRLCDIQSYAAGVLGCWDRPPSLRSIRDQLLRLRYEIPEPDHSAGGDVACLRACWSALLLEQVETLAARPALLQLARPLAA